MKFVPRAFTQTPLDAAVDATHRTIMFVAARVGLCAMALATYVDFPQVLAVFDPTGGSRPSATLVVDSGFPRAAGKVS